ncbi:hypothetical protein BDK51DRAFT_21502, partial [Blyttiomyces helicus]
RGICTGWLEDLAADALAGRPSDVFVPIFPRVPSDFRASDEIDDAPLLMIAAGTGIAPFVGFLDHLAAHRRNGRAPSAAPAETWLVYGHRFAGREGDGLYGDELAAHIEAGALGTRVDCVSREEAGAGKYVQDWIKTNGEEVWDLIAARKAKVLVCGSVAMSKDVHTALMEIAQLHGDLPSVVEAQAFWTELVKEKRYLRDIWA